MILRAHIKLFQTYLFFVVKLWACLYHSPNTTWGRHGACVTSYGLHPRAMARVAEWPWPHQTSDSRCCFYCFWVFFMIFHLRLSLNYWRHGNGNLSQCHTTSESPYDIVEQLRAGSHSVNAWRLPWNHWWWQISDIPWQISFMYGKYIWTQISVNC